MIFSSSLFFNDLYDDIHELKSSERRMLDGVREIEFPDGITGVDEEVWPALGDVDPDADETFLDKVNWLDFSQATHLKSDLCVSGLTALRQVVLPPNMCDISEARFLSCYDLVEVHIGTLGAVGRITGDGDRRLTVYASALSDAFFEAYADEDSRTWFARDVNTLFVPKAEVVRVQAIQQQYPLAEGTEIMVKPLSRTYVAPDSIDSVSRKARREAEKAAAAIASEIRYQADRREVEEQIAAEPVDMAPQTFVVKDIPFKMIYVRGGTFDMGDGVDGEHYPITLSSFMMCETVVTQELWRAVMRKNPSKNRKHLFFDKKDYPAEQMTKYQRYVFLEKLNEITGTKFRFPTRAEWQYAAKGGVKARGTLFAGSNNPDEVAWHIGNSFGHTHAVKQKSPNELGLYDMCGNVMEMCEGGMPFHAIKNAIVDPVPWKAFSVVGGHEVYQDFCGGDFMSVPGSPSKRCDVEYCDRRFREDCHGPNLGLRIVCDLPENEK